MTNLKYLREHYSESKIPRFLPTSSFLVIVDFKMFTNSSTVYFIKSRYEGQIINLAPLLLKNVFKPEMIG